MPLSPTQGAALSSTNTLPKLHAPYRPIGDVTAPTIFANEAASQDFDIHELVSFDSSGNVTKLNALAAPAANAVSASGAASAVATNSTLIIGMTKTAASNSGSASTTRNIEVLPSWAYEFLVRVYAATSTDAQVQDVLVGDRVAFQRYGGASISSTVRDCQTVATAAPDGTDAINKGRIVEIDPDFAATDQYPPVWVQVRVTACQWRS